MKGIRLDFPMTHEHVHFTCDMTEHLTGDYVKKVRSRTQNPTWNPAQIDPEFSDEVAQADSYETLKRDKIRKHLLYLNWKIDYRRDKNILRYRYRSPDGKIHFSLKEVFNSFICQKENQNCFEIGCTEPPKICQNGEDHDRTGEDHELIEPECLPDSIQNYIDFCESETKSEKKGYVSDLRLKAKKHLLFFGWTWSMRCFNTNSNRPRLFYESPAGKFFGSLVAACKAHMKDQLNNTRDKSQSPSSSLTDEFGSKGKPLVELNSLKRKEVPVSVSLSPDESQSATPLAIQETEHVKAKRLKRLNLPFIDRTKEREKVAVYKASRIRDGNSSNCTSPLTCPKTILNLLINKEIVVPRDRISYQHDISGLVLKEGWLSCTGVHCTCCNTSFSVPDFEIHAAGCKTESPLDNIYLRNGKSLLDCLLHLMERDRPGAALNTQTKKDYSLAQSDYLCAVCLKGGQVLFCNFCTSVYHLSCLGLKEIPDDDDWRCPSCSCMYCGSSECNIEQDQFCDQTAIYCDQCEDEYHVGCKRNKKKCKDISCQPTGPSFCGTRCSDIWVMLDGIVGQKNLTSKEGYTWTVLKYTKFEGGQSGKVDRWTKVEHNAKLWLAAEVLNECFMPIVDAHVSGSNLVNDMIFNKESEIKRLNYRGYYTIVMEKGDEVVSTATLRVHGEKFAEMALVGTRSQFRQQGLCKLLVASVEQLINYLGVKRFILPAAPQMLDMWIGKFGFNLMTQKELNDIMKYNILKFPGSPLCHKIMST